MVGTYLIYIILFHLLIFIINGINSFDQETKSNALGLFAVVYNTFLGYLDIYVFKLVKSYFSNAPLEVIMHSAKPFMASSFNELFGWAIIFIYFYCCTIPLNMFMCEKSKFKRKLFTKMTAISAITGMILYLIIN